MLATVEYCPAQEVVSLLKRGSTLVIHARKWIFVPEKPYLIEEVYG